MGLTFQRLSVQWFRPARAYRQVQDRSMVTDPRHRAFLNAGATPATR